MTHTDLNTDRQFGSTAPHRQKHRQTVWVNGALLGTPLAQTGRRERIDSTSTDGKVSLTHLGRRGRSDDMERELANAELEKGELVSAHGVLVKMRGMPVRTHARTHPPTHAPTHARTLPPSLPSLHFSPSLPPSLPLSPLHLPPALNHARTRARTHTHTHTCREPN